ncbi:MAG: hypothetical protein LC749_09155 [Actinobacteria bacterium]|nr:hypothetical protein [Actinomycetota bacterium]
MRRGRVSPLRGWTAGVASGAGGAVAGTATSVPGRLRRRKDEAGGGLAPAPRPVVVSAGAAGAQGGDLGGQAGGAPGQLPQAAGGVDQGVGDLGAVLDGERGPGQATAASRRAAALVAK